MSILQPKNVVHVHKSLITELCHKLDESYIFSPVPIFYRKTSHIVVLLLGPLSGAFYHQL
jgi:hypothetical protein